MCFGNTFGLTEFWKLVLGKRFCGNVFVVTFFWENTKNNNTPTLFRSFLVCLNIKYRRPVLALFASHTIISKTSQWLKQWLHRKCIRVWHNERIAMSSAKRRIKFNIIENNEIHNKCRVDSLMRSNLPPQLTLTQRQFVSKTQITNSESCNNGRNKYKMRTQYTQYFRRSRMLIVWNTNNIINLFNVKCDEWPNTHYLPTDIEEFMLYI